MEASASGLLPWTGVYVLLLGIFVGLWRVVPGIMQRANERQKQQDEHALAAAAAEAEAKAEHVEMLREEVRRLSQRVEALELKVEECERREDEWRHRAIEAEAEVHRRDAIELGLGQARQQAQAAVSADRLEQRQMKDKSE